MHLTLGGVMKDVQPHGPTEELPHATTVTDIGFRYQLR
jgi:hypothetical protein